MRFIKSLLLATSLIALPSLASAKSVLSPGELSVGAELFPSALVTAGDFVTPPDRNATPMTGFNVRYAFSQQLAVTGNVGLHIITVADDQEDPAAAYSVGVGAQLNFAESKTAAFLLKGGVEFIPRIDNDQELGVRLWIGPGVESRFTDALSLQFYTQLMDLQLGGDTRFDITVVPSVAMFIYF